jgi:hypothetical protein
MAKQEAVFISGKINNLVFYRRSSPYIVRSLPDSVNQSAATKRRSINFGIAARAAKILRQLLAGQLPFPANKSMKSRFGGAISKWLAANDAATLPPQHALPYISGFAFNESASISEVWKLTLTVTRINENLMAVDIPAFIPAAAIKAPPGSATVHITLAAASCSWLHPAVQGSSSKTISFAYNNTTVAAQSVLLAVPAGAGSLVLSIASIQFTGDNSLLFTAERYRPCNVIDARYC